MQGQQSEKTASPVGEIAQLRDLRCEYKVNPLGISGSHPRLSWKIAGSNRGIKQKAYWILVSRSEKKLAEGKGEVWDSGWIESSQSLNVPFDGACLKPTEKYFWKAKIRDHMGIEFLWSDVASWTVGKLEQEWEGAWIGSSQYRVKKTSIFVAPFLHPKVGRILPAKKRYLPIFRKDFNLSKPIRRAQVSICGLGQYVLSVNGEQVEDSFLNPAWSVYEKTVYYNTFDITELLKGGANTFGIMLGKGFYNTQGDRRIHGVRSGGELKLIFECILFYQDGSEVRIVSDQNWKTATGPISHSSILAGEDYDARRLPKGWDKPGFDDSSWEKATAASEASGRLTPAISLPMKEFESIKPLVIESLAGGVFIYDFEQNVSAIPHLNIRGKAGQKIRITPAEQRHGQVGRTNNGKGKVNQAGVGHNNFYEYTLNGSGIEKWKPLFTYGGFQYLQIRGAVPVGFPNPTHLPVIESLESIHVRNEAPLAGAFECSNSLLNQIDELITRAVCSNLGHVMTDCPTREKLGWLETTYLMGPALSRRYDASRFFAKVTEDIRDSQDKDGRIDTVAPNYPQFKGGFKYSPEWGAAGVILPWQLYRWYGDKKVLRDSYRMMKAFVDYLKTNSTDLLPEPGLGDWFDYGHGKKPWDSQYTPATLTAMASFYRCAIVLADTAKILDKHRDSQYYRFLADQIKSAFNEKFFDGKNEYQNNGSPQTANAIALSTGLVENEFRKDVVQAIVDDMKNRNYQQTAGDIGFYYLVDALADAGQHDVLYENVNRHEEGSYGFIVDRGWKSMPEAWDANTKSSMNHCMLGHIQKWFYYDLLGIRQTTTSTAFKEIVIAPAFPKKLNRVRGHYHCMYGKISVEWEQTGNTISLKAEIPPNTEASVFIPAKKLSGLTEGTQPLDQAEGVELISIGKGQAEIRVRSGCYDFFSKL